MGRAAAMVRPEAGAGSPAAPFVDASPWARVSGASAVPDLGGSAFSSFGLPS